MNDFDTPETASNSEKTMIATAANPEATLLGTTLTCPVCSTENAPNEKYCGDCGFLLSSTPGEPVQAAEPSESAMLVETSGQREFILRPGENQIGRENTDVLLSDPTISRRHALLTLDGGTCRLEDLGSTNGTYASGQQIQSGERVEVSDGAELKFGSVTLSLRLPTPSESDISTDEPIDEAFESSETIESLEEYEAVETETAAEEVEDEVAFAYEFPVGRLVSASDPDSVLNIMMGTNTIGRRSENNIVLSGDAYVSGSHAELIVDERGFWLVDIGSTNGTTLNGSRISPDTRMILNDGDEIVLGQSAFRFEIPPAGATEEETSEESESPETSA